MASQAKQSSLKLCSYFDWYRPWCKKFGQCLLLLVASLVLGGCLSTQFIYKQLDWVVVWYLGDIFSLDSEQEDKLQAVVQRNLDWIRTEQLPEYASLLRALDTYLQTDSLSLQKLEQDYAQVIALWDAGLRHALPDAAGFLAGLSREQVSDFIENAEEKNKELWEEYAGETPEERRMRRTKSAIKTIQRFTGRLNRGQKELVTLRVSSMHDNSAEWMQGRRQWQTNFHALLRERPPAQEFQQRFTDLMLNPNTVDRPEYREQVETNQKILFNMLIELVSNLDDRQGRRLSRRINKFADDFEELSEAPSWAGELTTGAARPMD